MSVWRVAALALLPLLSPVFATPAQAAGPTLEHQQSFGRRIARAPGKTNYPSGIAVDPKSGNVYVMDLLFNRVQKFTADGKFLLEWNCRQGLGLTVDPETGDVWVAMWTKHQVHKYSPEGKLLLKLGDKKGSGPGEFFRPHDVSVDPRNGDVYVLDTYNERVQIFGRDGTYKREFGGPFIQPFGIGVHPKGEFLAVANTKNREVLKFTLEGELIERYKRPGHGPGEFRWPRGMDVGPRGNIFVADTDNERLQKLDANAEFMQIIKGPDNREQGTFHPRAVAVNHSNGRIYAPASYSLRIDYFEKDGTYIGSFAQGDRDGPVFNTAKSVVVDPKTGDSYISDWMGHAIRRFDKNGKYLGVIDGWIEDQTLMDGSPLPPDFHTTPHTGMWPSKEYQSFPGPIDLDAEGNLWMLRGSMFAPQDPRAQAPMLVRCFDKDGNFIRGFSHESFPVSARMRGLVVDPDQKHVYVANTAKNTVMKFKWSGELVWQIGGKGTGPGQFSSPSGLQVDPEKGQLYVVDVDNHRVQIFDLDGQFVKEFGQKGSAPGEFKFGEFSSIAIQGNLIAIGDTMNHRVQFFDRSHAYVGTFGEKGFGKFGRYNGLSGVDFYEDRIYLVDTAGGQVEVFKLTE